MTYDTLKTEHKHAQGRSNKKVEEAKGKQVYNQQEDKSQNPEITFVVHRSQLIWSAQR